MLRIVRKYHFYTVALVLAVLISAVPAGSAPMASSGDVLFNGGFEQGFVAIDGCGMVGKGWKCFTNGGTAAYGFYDDQWDSVVFQGEHSQLIEINTKEKGGDGDRNAGIYQTVHVKPHETYELAFKGMIRADDNGGDLWRYRVYVGFDYHGKQDWQAVSEWHELPWDTYYPRTSPGSFSGGYLKVTPTTDRLTVFIRLQRKWGTWYEETDLNLDAIGLYGPMVRPPMKPQPMPEQPMPMPERPMDQQPMPQRPMDQQPMPQRPMDQQPMPMPEKPMWEQPMEGQVCDGPNVLRNGSFEHGFQPDGVGNYWVGWNNGGRANYGYYDETWDALVTDGEHGQLIEINTINVGDATDENRMSGIYQRVWLKPGATYEISLDAMMRERDDHSDEDFYRYMVEWGYSKNGGADVDHMDHWDRVVLDKIYLRTEPGEMQHYSAQFTAPSTVTTIWVFGIKKWATLDRELDVNVDNIQVRECRTGKSMGWPMQPDMGMGMPPMQPDMGMGMPQRPPMQQEMGMSPMQPDMGMSPKQQDMGMPQRPAMGEGQQAACRTYVVQRGDTLGAIAAANNSSVAAIAAASGIANPNAIYAGQRLCIPSGEGAMGQMASMEPAMQPMRPSGGMESMPAAGAGQSGQTAPMAQPTRQAAQVSPVAGSGNTHQVQRGDTLGAIAGLYGTTVDALMAANQISNPHWIFVGQRLRIPNS